MGDILNTTNTIIAIIVGCISICGTIGGILTKRRSVLQKSQGQPDQKQAEIVERWTGFALLWKIWLGIFMGIIGTVIATVVADGIINIFIAIYLNTQQHTASAAPDFSNPTVFIIAAIFGVMFGMTMGVSAAIGDRMNSKYRQW
jgi:hypothetical protein